MKSHAVKEIVADAKELEYLLCVEVEPQPDEAQNGVIFKPDSLCYVDADGTIICEIPSPISIGDIVYQGEEWWKRIDGTVFIVSKLLPIKYSRSSETMPIELADKTFKVIGIEVELRLPPDWDNEFSHSDSDKKWFWSYKLETIKSKRGS